MNKYLDSLNAWMRTILFWLMAIIIGETSIRGVPFTIKPQGKIAGWALIGGMCFILGWQLYQYIKKKTNGDKPVVVKG